MNKYDDDDNNNNNNNSQIVIIAIIILILKVCNQKLNILNRWNRIKSVQIKLIHVHLNWKNLRKPYFLGMQNPEGITTFEKTKIAVGISQTKKKTNSWLLPWRSDVFVKRM